MRRTGSALVLVGLWLIGYGGIGYGGIASGQPIRGRAGAASLPADVVAFRKRRDRCDHFRGEEPGDEARAIKLERALRRTCRGTDAQLAGLRARYRVNRVVIAALSHYEDEVE